jgi:hypothetical protein
MKKLIPLVALVVLLCGCMSLFAPRYDSSKLTVGMSFYDVCQLFGPPVQINRTTTKDIVYKQCVFSTVLPGMDAPFGGETLYLYFENDILKAWQD